MSTNKYLTNLTPLRGIAALLTTIFHIDLVLGVFGGELLSYQTSSFLGRMYLMVDFFFILSGFILCYVYAQNFANSVSGGDFRKFTIARFARVYPLHLFSLLLTTLFIFILKQTGFAISPIIDAENSVYSFITNLLLLQSMNLHKWFTFTHAAWSISTEWWMYMLFPFLVAPFLRLEKIGRLAILILCIAGYLLIGYVLTPLVTVDEALGFPVSTEAPPFSLNVSYQFGFVRCLVGFVIGMLVYRGYKDDWAKSIFSSGYTFSLLVIGLAVCLHFAVLDIVTVMFFPLILLSAAYGSQNLNAFLGSKPLQKLGDWSFSIYLIHQPFLYQGVALMSSPKITGIPVPHFDLLTSWIACVVFLVFILIVSYLTYRFIEVPARNYINAKWGKSKTARPVLATDI